MKHCKIIYIFCLIFILSAYPVAVSASGAQDSATGGYSQQPTLSTSELLASIRSETAVLIDGDTGQVLFEKNMHKKMYPASITKVMTAVLALENGNLNDTVTMSKEAVFSVTRGSSHIALDVGEELTLEQALYALAISSANDAANGIAERIGGSLEGFAELMNARAREAGALNTHFVNANGLPDEDHYTTAYDMARIVMEAIKEPQFSEIFTTAYYEMPPTNMQPEKRFFWSRNDMVKGKYQYDGLIAAKTGWTNEARHTLVTAARRDGRTLITVVMKSEGSNDKWEDSTALLNFGFRDFQRVSFSAGEMQNDEWIASEDFTCLIPASASKEDIQVKYMTENIHDAAEAKAVFSLPGEGEGSVLRVLGEIALQEPAAETLMVQKEEKSWLAGVLSVVAKILAGILVLLALGRLNRMRRRYDRRRRRRHYS